MMTDKPIETKTKKMKVECQSCNHKYSEDKINIHISETHETMKCDSCEYKCSGTIMLLRHQRMEHGAASGNDPKDDMFYHFELTYDIRVAKWRINDPDEEPVYFSLELWDENLGHYVRVKDCTRPGEHAEIKSIKKIKN